MILNGGIMNKKNYFVLIALFFIISSAFAQADWYLSVFDAFYDIEARVDTTFGTFAIGTHAEGINLTYQYDRITAPYYFGASNSFMVYIGGSIYRSGVATGGTEGVTVIDEYFLGNYIEDNTIISRWEIPATGGSYMIYQRLSPSARPADDTTLGMIKIEYEVDNRTLFETPIGLKLLINPKLDGIDNTPVAVGPYYTDVGVFFEDAIRNEWQAFQRGIEDSSDQLIARGDLGEDKPDQLGLGQWVLPGVDYYGLAERLWAEGTPPDWEGETYSDCGAMYRWNASPVGPGDRQQFVTYYGFGKPMPPDTNWASLSGFPTFASAAGCSLLQIVDLDAFITNITLIADSAESTIVCMELPASGGLMYEGPRCDTIGTLYALETGPIDLQFRIPDGYSAFETQRDTILINVTTVNPVFADITWEKVFTTPYMNSMPPTVEFIDTTLYEFINCSTFVSFYSEDEDTGVYHEQTRIVLFTSDTVYSLNPYSGIFNESNDTTYIGIDDTLITLEDDTLLLSGMVDVCITRLVDYLGCRIPDTICTNLTFDDEPPYVETISPSPGSNVSDCSQIIEIAVADLYSGIEPSTATLSISGVASYNIGSPELAYSGGSTGMFTFTPSTPFESGTELEICLTNLADLVPDDICSPNVMEDTCWTYWVDCEPPGDISILRPRNGEYIACETLDSLIMIVNDASGILLDSLIFDIDGTIYDGSMADLLLGEETFHYDTVVLSDVIALTEGYHTISVYNFYDSLYNFSGTIENVSFWVDFTSPEVGTPIPPDGASIGLPVTCDLPLRDELSGIDTTSIILTAEGMPLAWRGDYFWSSDTIRISTSPPGVGDGDTITLCLNNAYDQAMYCDGANAIEDSICWEYYVDALCPAHNLLTIDDGDHLSCCGTIPISIEFFDSSGIDPASIMVEANGVPVSGVWEPSDPGTNAEYQFPLYGTDYSDTSCLEVDIQVSSISDDLGNACAGSTWTVIMDCESPEMISNWPSGYVPHDDAWIYFEDDCSGILTDSTIVVVNIFRESETVVDTIYGNDPAVDWSSVAEGQDTLSWRYSDVGIMLENNDSLVVCVSRLSDNVDHSSTDPGCGNNVFRGDGISDACFSYGVTFAGPTTSMISPIANNYVPCQNFDFVIRAFDEDGIDETSFNFNIDGTDYFYDEYHTDPADTIADTIIVHDPSGAFPLCDSIFFEVTALEDIYGTAISTGAGGFFIVDIEAPVAEEFIPEDGGTLVGEDKRIKVIIRDPDCGSLDGAGVDRSSLIFTIDGIDYEEPIEPFVYWQGDTAIFDIDSSDVPITGGEEIEYCVTVMDNTIDLEDDGCDRNILNTCASFFMTAEGPSISAIRPNVGDIIACDRIDSFVVSITDAEGVDWSTLEITVGDDILTYSDVHDLGSGLISYLFVPPISEDSVITVSIDVSDVVDNESSYSYSFTLDHQPPVASFETPCGDTLEEINPDLEIIFSDELSTVDTTSVCIALCQPDWATCDTFCAATEPGLIWLNDTTLEISTSTLGYTVTGGDSGLYYIANAMDVVDSCDANDIAGADSCRYYVSADGPVVSLVPPLRDGMSIGCPIPGFCFYFSVTDSDGLRLPTMELSVYIPEGGGLRSYALGGEFYNVAGDTFAYCPEILEDVFSESDSTIMWIEVDDDLGNPAVAREFIFHYDTTAPGFVIHEPPLSGASTLSPDLIFEFPDSTGPDSLGITISLTTPDDITLDYIAPDPGVVFWQNDSLTIRHGEVFETNDTITICIDQLVDAVDTCANYNTLVSDSCWDIAILQGGPGITAVSPMPDSFGCPSECFIWTLTDEDGINISTLNIIVETDTFTIDSSEVSFDSDTLIFCPSDTISYTPYFITVEGVEDSLGYEMSSHLYTYNFDIEPPVVSGFSPIGDAAIYEIPISMTVIDLINPVQPESLRLHIIENRGADTTIYFFDDSEINWDDDINLLTFNDDSSYAFRADDSIIVCLEMPDSTGCPYDNWTDTCFTFNSPIGDGPRFTLDSPTTNGACVSCSSFTIEAIVATTDSLDFSTLELLFTSDPVGCYDTFTYDSPEVRFSPTADRMYFDVPEGCLADGAEISLELLEILDIYGNPGSMPTFTFHSDFSGPVEIAHGPTAPVSITLPTVWFAFEDSGCDIDTNSIVLYFNGSRYINDETMEWHGDTVFFTPRAEDRLSGGDIVDICVDTLLDVVDTSLCDANNIDSSACFELAVSAGGPIPELTMPIDGTNTSCDDQQIVIAFADSESVVDSTLIIMVAGDEYTSETAGGMWELLDDTLTFTPGPGTFADGEIVEVTVEAGTDSIGNPIVGDYSWSFTVDLSAPYADSIIPIPASTVYDWSQPITVYPRDSYSALAGSVLVSISDDGAPVGDFALADGALTYNDTDTSYTFDPADAGITFPEFHEICIDFWISDSTGENEYCPFNDTTISFCFEIGDDDTTGPTFAFDSCAWPAFSESLYVTVFIDDPSGVYDDGTDTSGQGVYVEIDTIGTFDPEFTTIIQMDRDSLVGDMFYSMPGAFPSERLREGMHFCYRVFAYDNDFDFSNEDDREQAVSDTSCCFIYNTDPPVLTVLDPVDGSYYSCTCEDTQRVSFVLHDFDHVRLDDMVIEINNIDYRYPDPRIHVTGEDTLKTIQWIPQNSSECFEDGDRITARIWDYSDRFMNFPEDTAEWVFVSDQTPPVLHYQEHDSVRLYIEGMNIISLYLADELAEIDESLLQIEIQLNEDLPEIFDISDDGLRYDPDSLYIDMDALALNPMARDSLFITVIGACDNAIGCGPNCLDDYTFKKFIKYETECVSHPKPFSPNNDSYNDIAKIEYPKRFERDAIVTIYDTNNNEIKKVRTNNASQYLWDGSDANGHVCRQGVYLFVVEVEGEVVCSGTIVLAR